MTKQNLSQNVSREVLKGVRVILTDLDLQQAEHRGIAQYAKSLISALNGAGADVWLLTDYKPVVKKVSDMPESARRLVELGNLLEFLSGGNCGVSSRTGGKSSSFIFKVFARFCRVDRFKMAFKKLKAFAWARLLSGYNIANLDYYSLSELMDSPYLGVERLSYLSSIQGILVAPNFYEISRQMARRRKSKSVFQFRLGKQFDALVTSCPLNICVVDGGLMIQTVHDLIPLEYARHPDDAIFFSRRLATCFLGSCLFVSESASAKYFSYLGLSSGGRSDRVVMQPPSLRSLASAGSHIIATSSMLSIPDLRRKEPMELSPFRYVLFVSSIEPRKNVLHAIRAFRLSGLSERGFKLCIAGKLKGDSYSKAVMAESCESVLLAGYIDEAAKAWLFLNSLMVLSPSLVEGFGIPVLDAASIGAQVLASNCASHREIAAKYDFGHYVELLPVNDPLVWAQAMIETSQREYVRIKNIDEERKIRIRRYLSIEQNVFEEFSSGVSTLVESARR